ncbi:putative uncharacterized protein DDB_G0287265 isoform X2 [Drosophila novamexicana]|uniref:putative uncharacterized protein DDB_G0287265 isoform X2 n=1 Tax=Drosophila novamexicana TaxID=47314 RepID=UPI0011E5ECFA|nr:putative uncharacterized protein DDB_G0287265 isoform X2 [Drosophila novamexicana]
MKMAKMWQLVLILPQLLLLMLLSSELYAADPELEHRQSLANRLSLGMAKQLYADRDNRNVNRNDNRNVNRNDNDNEDDDDYYTDIDNDNDNAHNRDYFRSDINLIDYETPRPSNWPRFPSSRSASTTATPTHRVRVPRHPHAHAHSRCLDCDNHLDAGAASDEANYQSDQVPGVLTAQKQKEVGSPESVHNSQLQYMQKNEERLNSIYTYLSESCNCSGNRAGAAGARSSRSGHKKCA